MKSTSTIVRSLHVLVLSLCGLSVYAFLLMLLVLVVELVVPTRAHAQVPGHLTTAPTRHIATLLSNGKVLVVLGAGQYDRSAEVYDPATGAWSATADLLEVRGSGYMGIYRS